MGETSTKPYLIRALHEWCTDNGYTPYITVQAVSYTHLDVYKRQVVTTNRIPRQTVTA